MENSLSKQIMLSILGIAILILAIVGVSYAVFVTTLTGGEENSISTGTISMRFLEDTDGILISNAFPMSDEKGKNNNVKGSFYDFVVTSNIAGVTTINYEIVAEKLDIDGVMLDDEDVKLYLQRYVDGQYVETPITMNPKSFTKDNAISILGSPANGMILYEGQFINNNANEQLFEEKFRLRIWVSNKVIIDDISRTFKLKLNVYGKVL